MMLNSSSTSPFPRRQLAIPRPTHGLIRPIYAGVFDIDPSEYDRTREVVLNWIRTHATVRAFAADLQGQNFELDRLRHRDGVLAQAATNSIGTITVARLQHQETTREGFDPARNWRTDVTVERDADAAWIAARTWFAGVASDERECAPPRFIKHLWREKALSDLDILEPTCRHLEYEADADSLAELILDDDRNLPVVVIADGCPLDPERLAGDSIGLAHVFRVSRTVRTRLLGALEFRYELNHGAVQTFFSRVAGALPVAPGARFDTVVTWRFGNMTGPAAFAKWLHEEMGRAVALRLLNDTAHRTVESVRVVAIEAQRAVLDRQAPGIETLRTQVELANEERDLLKLENRDLERQMIELTARMEKLSSERTTLDDDLRAERARNYSLQQEKASLHYMLASKNGSERITLDSRGVEALIRQQPTPATVFDAVDQAKSLLYLYNAPVTVTDTALEAAMDCPFLRPEEVLSALVSLGFLWEEIKAGSGSPLAERVREKLGHRCAMRESEMTMNKFGDERKLHYDGREIVLEKHITLGGGPQNATTTAQIYFGDKEGQLLIGHVGRHLNTVSTQ